MIHGLKFRITRLTASMLISLLVIAGIKLTSAGSNFTDAYEKLFTFVTIISYIVFIGVSIVLAKFVIQYREDAEGERKVIGHTMAKKLEFAWTSLAIFIILVLMFVSYPVLFDISEAANNSDPNAEVVIIEGTGNWEWIFYTKAENGTYIKNTPETDSNNVKTTTMELKVGKQYKFVFWASGQWIHSFYSPGLNFKMDVVPGTNNTISIVIESAGTYEVLCAEFCGAGHSFMRGEIIAVV